MGSQENNSDVFYVFKCANKWEELIVFEIDANSLRDAELDISKLFPKPGGGTVPGATNGGRAHTLSPGIPCRGSGKKAKLNEYIESGPALKKRRTITSEPRRENTEGDKFSCCLCYYKTTNNFNLKKHSKTHLNEKPFACNRRSDFEERTFPHDESDPESEGINLPSHLWRYIGEKPYTCKLCDYKCIKKSDLKLHSLSHHRKEPYSCDKCNFKTNNKISLKVHLISHSSEKPFACNLCEFKCNHKGSLKNHLRTHTGEKPFACNKCDYRCNQTSNLKRHLLSHVGTKPFACTLCEYTSSRRDNLKQHLITHTDDKPYVCNNCDYKCCDKRMINRHMLKVHGDNSQIT